MCSLQSTVNNSDLYIVHCTEYTWIALCTLCVSQGRAVTMLTVLYTLKSSAGDPLWQLLNPWSSITKVSVQRGTKHTHSNPSIQQTKVLTFSKQQTKAQEQTALGMVSWGLEGGNGDLIQYTTKQTREGKLVKNALAFGWFDTFTDTYLDTET